jgi:dienelactone hydrolase
MERMGVTGFPCYGGGVSNTLRLRLPNLIKAAVPYYGAQPNAENSRQKSRARCSSTMPSWTLASRAAGQPTRRR